MLERILETKRAELNALPPLDPAELTPSTRDFRAALLRDGLSIIAEVKRRSPSAGTIADGVVPLSQARRYAAGGARALSVLVDRTYFDGSWDDLTAVARGVDLPVLCKEFVLDVRQVHHARRAGADACLLIAAALDNEALHALRLEIERWAMDALVEVHDERELERAVACGAGIIGINNRNLRTMEIDRDTIHRLAPRAPEGCVLVAESGYRDAADLATLPDRADAVLAGTALMCAPDPAATLREWMEAARSRPTPGGANR